MGTLDTWWVVPGYPAGHSTPTDAVPLLTIVLLAASPSAHAADVGAVVSTLAAVDTANDRPGEDVLELHSRFRLFTDGVTGKGTPSEGKWFVEARAEHHLLSGVDTEAWYEPSLGETGWEGGLGGPFRLAVGQRIERWGKLDYLPVADVLNPRDLRNGPLTPQEWQRIPIPMATLQVGTDPTRNVSFRSETTWLPFASHDLMWLRGTDWSYIRNGMVSQEAERIGGFEGETAALLGELIRTAGQSVDTLDPSHRRALDSAIGNKKLPQALVYNSEIAQRFEIDGPGFDAALMGAWMRNRQPLSELDPTLTSILKSYEPPDVDEMPLLQRAVAGGPLDVSYPRTAFVGAEASTLVGPIGVRAEGGWWSHKTTRLWWGQATTLPTVNAGLGLDYVRGSNLQITAEARYEQRIAPPTDLLLVAPQELMFAGGGRYGFAQDRFRLQLGGSYSVAFAEWMFLPTFEWRPTSHWRASVGAVLLDGPWNAPPGMPRAYIYEGGPGSYWSQNDMLTFGLSWVY